MALRSKLVRLSGIVAVTLGLVLAPLSYQPASAAELILDGGFEAAGSTGDSPSWTEADSAFGSPLCTIDPCSNGGGTAGPRTGTVWAWFGGNLLAGHNSSLSQAVTIPTGSASLTYWYWNGGVTEPFDATLTVKVDGTTLKTHTEASANEAGYTEQRIDLTTYADGGSHTLLFSYLNGGDGTNNMSVDDVSIATAPQTSITSSPAGGKAKSLSVPIGFTSTDPAATYDCAVDNGAFAPCTNPKTVTVTPGQHTFKVAAKDAEGSADQVPATVTFTAYDCPTLTAAVTAAQTKADAAATKVKKAKKKLKAAKKSGDQKAIKKAKKKLKKAKQAKKAADAGLAAAKAAAVPCA